MPKGFALDCSAVSLVSGAPNSEEVPDGADDPNEKPLDAGAVIPKELLVGAGLSQAG